MKKSHKIIFILICIFLAALPTACGIVCGQEAKAQDPPSQGGCDA